MSEKLTVEDVAKVVNEYPTKYEYGLTSIELSQLLLKYNIDRKIFYEKLGVNTCMIIENQTINYHCDIEKALYCVLENRDQLPGEWD
jgi:hypothetical protein